MRPSFHPRLINDPFEDPGLFVPFTFQNRAVLFDLGDISSLSARDILKITHVFITHTHMDHFIGFDHLLRILLGREKDLHLFGPSGFIKNMEGKLAGYTWNLVENYSNPFTLHVTEIRQDALLKIKYICRNRFSTSTQPRSCPFDSVIHEEPSFKVSVVLLDHDIVSLGYSMKERFHINIKKENLNDLGLETGPWLNRFKTALFNDEKDDSTFMVNGGPDNNLKKTFALGELARKIAIFTPGQKITYIADAGYSPTNRTRMIDLAKNSDHLFIEAAFLHQHKDIAKEKKHLTAAQAGTIAGEAGVKQFTCFHFSPRYMGQGELLQGEAAAAYERATGHPPC